MQNQNKKGRPPKPKDKVEIKGFSVWVTEAQREQIKKLIEKSGLSASKYFLSLAINTPLKLPQRRTLPADTAELIRMLKQLAGIFSLTVLKTKDQQMQSENWRASSQSIKHTADLMMLWIYEDFQIRDVQKILSDIKGWMSDLYAYQSSVLPDGDSKKQILEKTLALYHASLQLLEKYEEYYQPDQVPDLIPTWSRGETGGDIHNLIERTLDQIANRRRR
ncbi:MAG TPA: hypothetical protein VGN64_01635 [Dyadobacter sp.]|jgi:hypothetical protein|nr:hypothetical protein [Dyadobacter sp.]